MSNSTTHLLFLLTMAMASFALTTAYDWLDDALTEAVIRRTCAKTHLYSFCVKAVKSFPVSYVYRTPLDVAQTLVQLLGWHANDIILNLDRRVGSVIGYKKGSFIDNLRICADLYDKIYTVDYYAASKNLTVNNFKVAEQRMLMAYKRAQGCEAGFRRIQKIPFKFMKQNTETCQLALVAAGATHQLIR